MDSSGLLPTASKSGVASSRQNITAYRPTRPKRRRQGQNAETEIQEVDFVCPYGRSKCIGRPEPTPLTEPHSYHDAKGMSSKLTLDSRQVFKELPVPATLQLQLSSRHPQSHRSYMCSAWASVCSTVIIPGLSSLSVHCAGE